MAWTSMNDDIQDRRNDAEHFRRDVFAASNAQPEAPSTSIEVVEITPEQPEGSPSESSGGSGGSGGGSRWVTTNGPAIPLCAGGVRSGTLSG